MDKPLTPVDVWNQIIAPKYIRWRHILVDGLTGHGHAALAQQGPAQGDRVLDVGCGMGDTSVDLGRRVGSQGSVLGVDPSHDMVRFANERFGSPVHHNLHFEVADARRLPVKKISVLQRASEPPLAAGAARERYLRDRLALLEHQLGNVRRYARSAGVLVHRKIQ